MESWLQRLVLATALTALCPLATAQEPAERKVLEDIVSPDLERRMVKENKIDTENIEIGLFAGVLSTGDFGTGSLYGGRLGLYITEDFFIEANAGFTQLEETSYETLSGEIRLLTDSQRELSYYNLSLGINIFPGEVYIGSHAFNHNLYLTGGAGNTLFADNEYFTYQFGGGFRLFLTDWVALRLDVRNHVFTHNIFGEDKEIQNLETHVGLSLFF